MRLKTSFLFKKQKVIGKIQPIDGQDDHKTLVEGLRGLWSDRTLFRQVDEIFISNLTVTIYGLSEIGQSIEKMPNLKLVELSNCRHHDTSNCLQGLNCLLTHLNETRVETLIIPEDWLKETAPFLKTIHALARENPRLIISHRHDAVVAKKHTDKWLRQCARMFAKKNIVASATCFHKAMQHAPQTAGLCRIYREDINNEINRQITLFTDHFKKQVSALESLVPTLYQEPKVSISNHMVDQLNDQLTALNLFHQASESFTNLFDQYVLQCGLLSLAIGEEKAALQFLNPEHFKDFPLQKVAFNYRLLILLKQLTEQPAPAAQEIMKLHWIFWHCHDSDSKRLINKSKDYMRSHAVGLYSSKQASNRPPEIGGHRKPDNQRLCAFNVNGPLSSTLR